MIKIDMTSPDVDKQIELLKHFPDIASKHFKPALHDSTQALYAAILPNIPERTGKAKDSFGSKVSGKGIGSLKGWVGWKDDSDYPWYIKFSEGGTDEHEVKSGKVTNARYKAGKGGSGALRWWYGGGPVFAKKMMHPGVSAVRFMDRGLSSTTPFTNARLLTANEAVVRDLAAI